MLFVRSLLLLSVFFSAQAWAAEVPKIVTVDLRAGVMQSEEARVKMEKLKQDFAQEEADIVALREEVKKMNDRLVKDGAVMTADEKRKLEQDLAEKGNEFKFKGQQFQQRTQAEAQEVFKSLLPKFEKALNEVVDEKKIDVVLHREAALIVAPKYEITELVTKKMNAAK